MKYNKQMKSKFIESIYRIKEAAQTSSTALIRIIYSQIFTINFLGIDQV